MQYRNQLIYALFCIVAFTSTICSGFNIHQDQDQDQELKKTTASNGFEITGDWVAECLVSPGIKGYPKGYHYTKYYYIIDNEFETEIFLFKDVNANAGKCLSYDLTFLVVLHSNFTLGEFANVESEESHVDISIITNSVVFVPYNDYGVTFFNSGDFIGEIYSGYGVYGWIVENGMDVTEIDEVKKNFAIGKEVFDIVQISNMEFNGNSVEVLRIGSKQGRLDKNGRPMTIGKVYSKFFISEMSESP